MPCLFPCQIDAKIVITNKNKIYNTNIILNLWNDISVDFDKYPDMIMYCRKNLFIDKLKTDLNMCDEIINNIETPVEVHGTK